MIRHSIGVICVACLLAAPGLADSPTDPPRQPDAATREADSEESAEGHEDHGPHDHHDEIVVTITGTDRQQFDVIQGSSVLVGEELQRAQASNLGETVSGTPGTRSTGYAPGAGRPVIRGLDGPRVRTLQNGVGNIDASVTSPDHLVATEPLLAERIEVVRGAGTLRYGSNAVGGVVNVVDGVIPESIPEGGVKGAFRSGYSTNADERTASGAVRLGTGHFAIQGQGFIRRSHDLEVPGDPLSSGSRDADDPFASASGKVPASDQSSQGGDVGVSYIHEKGFFGIGFSRLESEYGLPVAEEHEEEEGEEEGHEEEEGPTEIRLDAKQNRYHAAGAWELPIGPFASFRFRGVYGDYEHAELEGNETGTVFTNRGFEGRLEAHQEQMGNFSGLAGLQLRTRDLEAVGAEAFLPQSDTTQSAIFLVEEWRDGPMRIDAGLRYELTDLDVSGPLSDRRFHSFSGSLGAAYELGRNTLVGLALSVTERPPIAEELYSDGPHLATATFEVGDDGLDEEIALGVELTFKHRGERTRGGLNLFYTSYEDFIFQGDTGLFEDGLPVRQYRQTDADFFGAELELAHDIYQGEDVTLTLDGLADWVRGRTNSGENLPRIAPLRLRAGAEARSQFADLRLEVEWVDAQTRTAAFETRTDDYTMFHASLTLRPLPDVPRFSVLIQGRNLTDTRGRNHVSFLKERVPLAGRDVRVAAEWRF